MKLEITETFTVTLANAHQLADRRLTQYPGYEVKRIVQHPGMVQIVAGYPTSNRTRTIAVAVGDTVLLEPKLSEKLTGEVAKLIGAYGLAVVGLEGDDPAPVEELTPIDTGI